MEILKGIEIVDLALFIKKTKSLIIGDMHIGSGEAFEEGGLLIPVYSFKDIIDRLTKIIDKTKPKEIIICGDLKHEFGRISNQEWREILQLIDFLKGKANLIIIKGNHDAILEPVVKKRGIKLVDFYKIDDITLLHGDKVLLNALDCKKIIMGHEHPAVTIKDGVKREKFKCFLKGKWNDKILIVLSSFNLLSEGSDITREKMLSPFLNQDLGNFEVYIIGDKIYNFGKVKNL